MDRILEFAGNHTLLVFALVTSFFLLIFSELRRKASGMLLLDSAQAVKLMNNDAAIIDLRSAEAFGRGHIAGARNVPFDELEARIEKLGAAKSTPLITVCDVGMTSTKAIDSLRKTGFESVYGLRGGMSGWTQSGLPVVTGKKTKRKQ